MLSYTYPSSISVNSSPPGESSVSAMTFRKWTSRFWGIPESSVMIILPYTRVLRSIMESTSSSFSRWTVNAITNSSPAAEKEKHIQNSVPQKYSLWLICNSLTYKIFLGNAQFVESKCIYKRLLSQLRFWAGVLFVLRPASIDSLERIRVLRPSLHSQNYILKILGIARKISRCLT